MTNYNERLDEALALIKYSVEYRETHGGCPPKVSAIKRHGIAEAKQALTSLIKELVAEAKPARAIISDDELGIDRARKSASNCAMDVYEQNLLKALEEV